MSTSPFAVGIMFLLAWVVFAVPVAWYLWKAWERSRMKGFLWLLVALVVWPAVARVVTVMLGVAGVALSGMTFGARRALTVGMSLGETVIGGVLLVIAVVTLYRELTVRVLPASVAPPPPMVGMDSGI